MKTNKHTDCSRKREDYIEQTKQSQSGSTSFALNC